MDQDQEVLDARAKLAARLGDGARTGGKGMKSLSDSSISLGTQRRKKKVAHKENVNEDKKLMSAIKKYGNWNHLNLPQDSNPFKILRS
jgi:hypothetical protein